MVRKCRLQSNSCAGFLSFVSFLFISLIHYKHFMKSLALVVFTYIVRNNEFSQMHASLIASNNKIFQKINKKRNKISGFDAISSNESFAVCFGWLHFYREIIFIIIHCIWGEKRAHIRFTNLWMLTIGLNYFYFIIISYVSYFISATLRGQCFSLLFIENFMFPKNLIMWTFFSKMKSWNHQFNQINTKSFDWTFLTDFNVSQNTKNFISESILVLSICSMVI